jgi:two-component system sensor histidine kinase CpxA
MFGGPKTIFSAPKPKTLLQHTSHLLSRWLTHGGQPTFVMHLQVKRVGAGKGGAVSITMEDSGPGIPAAELGEVFKPSYRPAYARQRETGGAGLGLAIVKTCVEACGGTVQCRNRSPKGLEAEIRLPAAKG